MSRDFTRGVLFVHSCPRALCPHIEWAAQTVLDQRLTMEWTPQPAQAETFRSELAWVGPTGTGARLASALRGWEHLRYEVTEDATATTDGGRWSQTPDLGIFHAQTDVLGNVVIPEERVRAALESTDVEEIHRILSLAVGAAWDEELETFRYAGAGAPVRWLHKVG